MRKHITTLVALFCTTLLACDSSLHMPLVAEVDLSAEFGQSDLDLVGVTVSPDGRRYVMDATRGLYEVAPDGAVTEVLAMADFPEPQVGIIGSFTDIAALDNGQFALTATNFGYLLDVQQNTLIQHFCYLPDADAPFTQVTRSLTFDRPAGLLYAQPQTFENVSGDIRNSLVGRFDRGTGDDLDWFALNDSEYSAGAIAMEASGTLLMGSGSRLVRNEIGSGDLTQVADIAEHGISDIVGMTIDEDAGTLLVVDGPSARLVELTLAE